MITIVHTRSGDWPAKGWADAYGPRGGRVKDEDYAIGANKPNYPMPAIPLAVAIHPNLIQIAEVYWLDEWLETQDTLPIQMAEFELVFEYP